MKLPFPMLMLLCFAIPCGIAWQLDWAGSGNPGISPNAEAKGKSVAKPGSRQPCPVRAEESAAGQRSRIHNWAAHASAGDLYATLRDIPGLPVELCDEVRAICMRRLCELDPKGAIIFAGTAFSRREETRALTRECLQNLILQDPEKTMEFLDQLPWFLRQEGSRIALQSLAVSDHPDSAMLCRKLEERWPGWGLLQHGWPGLPERTPQLPVLSPTSPVARCMNAGNASMPWQLGWRKPILRPPGNA